MIRKILVATHGSKGAVEAEQYALDLARTLGAELHALYVIHRGWGSLVGIEWLHSSERRMEFYRYAESELYRMADSALDKFTQRAAACGVTVTVSVRVGDPGEAIALDARERGSDLIVLGDVCKRRSEEYKARINVGRLLRSAPCSVLQVKADARAKGAVLTCEAGEPRIHQTANG
jgi:nucleotide-binding universal stress UspA family protein